MYITCTLTFNLLLKPILLMYSFQFVFVRLLPVPTVDTLNPFRLIVLNDRRFCVKIFRAKTRGVSMCVRGVTAIINPSRLCNLLHYYRGLRPATATEASFSSWGQFAITVFARSNSVRGSYFTRCISAFYGAYSLTIVHVIKFEIMCTATDYIPDFMSDTWPVSDAPPKFHS